MGSFGNGGHGARKPWDESQWIHHQLRHAINSVGTSVGTAHKYDSAGNFLGDPAVRWDASGTVTELQTFVAPGAEPYTRDRAYSINDAGTAVGSSEYFYSGGCEDCGYQGFLPVRWDASGTAVTVLGGQTAVDGEAYAINDTGTAVGYVNTLELDGSGYALESRAIRWEASATATKLGILPSLANFKAFAINDAGMAVGSAKKHDGSGNDLGVRGPLGRLWHGYGAGKLGDRSQRLHGQLRLCDQCRWHHCGVGGRLRWLGISRSVLGRRWSGD